MGNLSIIKDIQQNKLEPDQLINCLDIPQNYILSNAIKQVAKQKLDSKEVIEKLARLSALTKEENKLMGIYTVGHLAVAALHKLGSEEALRKYEEILSSLRECDKESVKKIIEHKALDE